MTEHVCDVAIIGAGTAGLAAERSARRAGARTLLIDEHFAGTTCADVGCMPSKLLIAAAESAHRMRGADRFGVHAESMRIDGKEVMERVRSLRDHFVSATKKSFRSLPDGICVKARARFAGADELALDNGDTVRPRAVVIATGSAPGIPGPFEDLGDRALTNRTIFELEDLPGSLAVVGGGSIGLEMAQSFARLGVRVVLFDLSDTIGGVEDDEAQTALQAILREEFPIHLGVELTATDEGDAVRIGWSGNGQGAERFDYVLVAAGRPPQIDDLGLDRTGLSLSEDGVPQFDRHTMQCGDAPIFMAGDCDGDEPVLHHASEEGAIAGRNAVAWPAVIRSERSPVFRVTFTDPPIAIVGEVAGDDALASTASYESQGRATVEGRAKGLARLYASKKGGRFLGATLVAPGADHLAHQLVAALMQDMTVAQIRSLPRYHPTLEEGLSSALDELCDASGLDSPGDEDRGPPPGA